MMTIEVPHALYMRMLRAAKKRLPTTVGFSDETLVYLYAKTALQEAVDNDDSRTR